VTVARLKGTVVREDNIMRGMRRARLVALATVVLGLAAAPSSFAVAGPPDQVGEWGPVLDWGVQGKHMVLLHNGKVLIWSQGDQARVWNPATGQFTLTPAPFGDIHCGGQVTLADGRVLVVGGQLGDPHVGIKATSIFDPVTNTWSRGADMAYERWYPTLTTMADGRAFVTSGDDANRSRIDVPEIYDPKTDTWTPTTAKSQGLYPFMYQLPDGKIYEAGTKTSTSTYDPETARWSAGPTAPFGSSSYSESGAMYAPGKILRAGGGDPAMNRTQVIDTTASSPAWRETAPMAFPRRRMNTPILLDGSIMAVGGTRRSDDKTQAVLDGEIWSPDTERWTTVAAMSEARMYHSTALVLPDGRVVTAGGEAEGRLRAQIYSPPYLFKGPRPVISSSPASADYGASFTVSTDATDIAKVALLRPSGVTHAIDMNQRYVPLSFTKSGTSVNVTAPRSANHAPPGYYMLVVTNSQGVPSVAKWVRLGGGSTPPPPPPGAPTAAFSATPTSGTAPLTVAFADASTGSPTSWAWDFQNDGTVDSTERNPSFTYTAPGTYSVKLTATNAGGSDAEVKTGYVTVGDSGPPPGTQALAPVADAHVKNTSPSKNYGTLTSLRVRNGGTSSDTYRTYLKFDVTGLSGPATSAKLRLFVTDESPDGGSVFKVGNGWTETGLTWANAPAIAGSSLGSAGATANGTWAEVDVTPAVTGNGELSFAVTTTSSNSSYYTSREGTANRPQLVIGGGTPPPTGPTADFSATPTTGTAPLKVDFSDASTGSPTAWLWDFDDDGTIDSTERNPSFTYTSPGTYTVRLAVADGTASDEEVKTGYVTVGSGGPPPGTQTFAPVADAQVKNTSPSKNYGTLTSLRLRNGGTSSDTYRSYLKFDVSGLGGPAASAKLRLFVTDSSPDGGSVFGVSSAWTETGITWANAPAIGGTSLASAGATTNGTWVDFDVTPAVSGNGEVSFALTTTSSNSSYYTSREGTANRPQLVVMGGDVPATVQATSLRTASPTSTTRSRSVTAITAVCPLPGGTTAARTA
jgi:PKD repeat protein